MAAVARWAAPERARSARARVRSDTRRPARSPPAPSRSHRLAYAIEGDRLCRGVVEHAALDAAHHVHLARLAVEAQGQRVAAAGHRQRLRTDRALHAGDTLGLLGTQAQTPAHAVLGDHQAHVAEFLMALVRGVDDLHAVPDIEVVRLVVV